MPTVNFAPGVNSSPTAFYNAIDTLTSTATVTSFSTTHILLTQGFFTFDIIGTGFTFGLVGGQPGITGGTMTGLDVRLSGALQMTVSALSLGAAAVQLAINADLSGANNAAIENLFLPLGWTYNGNNADDIFLPAFSSDGIPLNLSGNDVMNTGGGNDDIFLGDGNDTADGGTGDDRFDGGFGSDLIYGGKGRDTLLGGGEKDFLRGGTDNDSLDGGRGSDRLLGGTGNDTLNGGLGGGVDTFMFTSGDGVDRINDFTLASDRIDLAPGLTHSFTASGGDSILHYGLGTDQILLVGIDISQTASVTII
jgi:Ca2+-binding RTX toxin-like protein